MTAPILNRRLTVDLRPGGHPPELEYRDHQVLADGLLAMVMNNQLSAKHSRQILEHTRERMPGQNHLDEAILQQVRAVFGIEELPE